MEREEMGWDTFCKSNRNRTKFSFSHSPTRSYMFYLQCKGKTAIAGTTTFYKSTKKQTKWHSKVRRGSQNPLPLLNLRFIQQLFLFQVLKEHLTSKPRGQNKILHMIHLEGRERAFDH